MTRVLPVAGARINLVGAPAVTVRVAVALLSPAAVTVIVAFPIAAGVKLDVALPAVGATGSEGLKLPDTPLTANEIGLIAALTVLPAASWIVAV